MYGEEDERKFLAKCIEAFGNRFDMRSVVYEGHMSKITVTCTLHQTTFEVVATDFLQGKGCRQCTDIKELVKRRSYENKAEDPNIRFIEKAIAIHGDRYTYENARYIDCRTKISITCREHGSFETTPRQHILAKSNCPRCGIKQASKSRMCTLAHFIMLATYRHGHRYDYGSVRYEGYDCVVTIICHEHGQFQQTVQNHLRGSGCPKCGKNFPYTTDTYIARAKQVHGNRYDYSKVDYTGAHKKIKIICNNHGVFEQVAFNHLQGSNCRLCWQESNCSKAQIDWLEYIAVREGIHIQHAMNGGEFKIPGSRYLADGYCPVMNLVFEYHGSVYHGDPVVYERSEYIPYLKSTAGELYDKTMRKETFIRDQGFELVTMWETEWLKIRRKVTTIQKAVRLWLKKRHKYTRR